jgi:hypothetical protein
LGNREDRNRDFRAGIVAINRSNADGRSRQLKRSLVVVSALGFGVGAVLLVAADSPP